MKRFKPSSIIFILCIVGSIISYNIFNNTLISIALTAIGIGLIAYFRRSDFISYKANRLYGKEDYEGALALYKKASLISNASNLTKITYAYRLLHQGHTQESISLLKTLDPQKLDDTDQLNFDATYAVVLWKTGKLDQAVELLENVSTQKDSVMIFETLGYLLLCLGKYEEALSFNTKAFRFTDQSAIIKDNLAASYYFTHQDKKAAKLYKQLINENVNFPEPYYYYGLLLNDKEKYEKALKYLKLATQKKQSFLSELKHEDIYDLIHQIEEYLDSIEPNKINESSLKAHQDEIEYAFSNTADHSNGESLFDSENNDIVIMEEDND